MHTPILRFDPHSQPSPHILPVGPQVRLEITRGRVQQRMRQVHGRVFLIGTASDCDLVLGDLQFPEAYAYLFVSGGQVTIRRLGSGPQLVVCGEPVEAAELFHGDLVVLGPFELRILIDEPPRKSRPTIGVNRTGVFSDSGEDDRAEAIDEVQMLLADIRRALAEESLALRIYDDSVDEGCRTSQRRASA